MQDRKTHTNANLADMGWAGLFFFSQIGCLFVSLFELNWEIVLSIFKEPSTFPSIIKASCVSKIECIYPPQVRNTNVKHCFYPLTEIIREIGKQSLYFQCKHPYSIQVWVMHNFNLVVLAHTVLPISASCVLMLNYIKWMHLILS